MSLKMSARGSADEQHRQAAKGEIAGRRIPILWGKDVDSCSSARKTISTRGFVSFNFRGNAEADVCRTTVWVIGDAARRTRGNGPVKPAAAANNAFRAIS